MNKTILILIMVSILLLGLGASQGFDVNVDQTLMEGSDGDSGLSSLFDNRYKQGGNSADILDSDTGSGRMLPGSIRAEGDVPDVERVVCEDSDNGRKFDIPGNARGKISYASGVKTYYDRCLNDEKTLVETYCNEWTGLVQFNKVVCYKGCETSENGAAYCDEAPLCIDTDKSNDPKIKGYLILFNQMATAPRGSIGQLRVDNKIKIVYEDVCHETENAVYQYRCGDNEKLFRERKTDCLSGQICQEGKCIIRNRLSDEVSGNIEKASKESAIKKRSKTFNQNQSVIEILAGGSADVNGFSVMYSAKSNSLSFDTTMTQGQFNLEGMQVNLGDSLQTGKIDDAGSDSAQGAMQTKETSAQAQTNNQPDVGDIPILPAASSGATDASNSIFSNLGNSLSFF